MAVSGGKAGLSPRARGNLFNAQGQNFVIGPIPASAGEPFQCSGPKLRHRAYPRERGGTAYRARLLFAKAGLSPRARGNPLADAAMRAHMPQKEAYPRERGGTAETHRSPGLTKGLSPRARGNQAPQALDIGFAGPIPASAGEPSILPRRCPSQRAYPRERGGTPRGMLPTGWLQGLSPRARGNLVSKATIGSIDGPIPASAGEPGQSGTCRCCRGAYPRERGGTPKTGITQTQQGGLSPRARGNRASYSARDMMTRPIPASAGEPKAPAFDQGLFEAYPRERGGTFLSGLRGEGDEGLSPRARGNHRSTTGEPRRRGPIPASAGEPMTRKPWPSWQGAYPRERGGTQIGRSVQFGRKGLSPRARGNLRARMRGPTGSGPIPASAGEPRSRNLLSFSFWAYPRERGGTISQVAASTMVLGLSPRARGNRRSGRCEAFRRGPIPASAGEPPCPACPAWAYPRERGGTWVIEKERPGRRGLSPRARGNRAGIFFALNAKRPIPASAGEPHGFSSPPEAATAYPRERGGTEADARAIAKKGGLSPRARGNPIQNAATRIARGPIPASAGEPLAHGRARIAAPAYPRERGGTPPFL